MPHTCSNIDKLKIVVRARLGVLTALIAAGTMNLLGLASDYAGIRLAPDALTFGLTVVCTLACVGCLCVLGYLLAWPRNGNGSQHRAARRNLEDYGVEGAPNEAGAAETTAEVAPAGGMTGQDGFLAEVDRRLTSGSRAGLIAVVRMANFDSVAAFDHQVAKLALQQFGERLRSVIRTSRGMVPAGTRQLCNLAAIGRRRRHSLRTSIDRLCAGGGPSPSSQHDLPGRQTWLCRFTARRD